MGVETLAIAGLATTILGAGVSAYSAVKQGDAQHDAANYQAAVDKNNATIASWNAGIAEQSNEAKTQAIQRAGALRLGAQRAALGAGGVDVDSGSSMDVQNATTEDTGRAAVAQDYQGTLTGYGFRTQGQNFLNSATMSTASGANAAAAGQIGAATTFLAGAGQVADRWYRYAGPWAPTPEDKTGMGVQAGLGGLY